MSTTKLDHEDDDDVKTQVIHDEHGVGQNLALDDSIEETNPRKGVWLIACTVSMGGFLFGITPSILHNCDTMYVVHVA